MLSPMSVSNSILLCDPRARTATPLAATALNQDEVYSFPYVLMCFFPGVGCGYPSESACVAGALANGYVSFFNKEGREVEVEGAAVPSQVSVPTNQGNTPGMYELNAVETVYWGGDCSTGRHAARRASRKHGRRGFIHTPYPQQLPSPGFFFCVLCYWPGLP